MTRVKPMITRYYRRVKNGMFYMFEGSRPAVLRAEKNFSKHKRMLERVPRNKFWIGQKANIGASAPMKGNVARKGKSEIRKGNIHSKYPFGYCWFYD